jgi:GGDEF domain-containing protein
MATSSEEGFAGLVPSRDRAQAPVLATFHHDQRLDIAGFKQINDTRGHHVGDAVLAEMVRACARSRGALTP